MSCVIESGDFQNFDSCLFHASGIRRIYISNWIPGTEGRITVNTATGEVTSVLTGPFVELPIDRDSANYSETYNPDDEDYTVELSFDIVGLRPDRSISADALAKGSFVVVFQDYNGNWWLTFYENGTETTEALFQTGQVQQEKNDYSYVWQADQGRPAIGVTVEFDPSELLPDCSDSHTLLALSSTIPIPVFEDCLVCDHPDVSAPSIVC